MFLALRELSFARGRFALMGSVVALIAILMVLLSGLSVGLVNDGVSGLKKLPVTSFAFQKDIATDSAFSRSLVPTSAVGTWAEQPGVEDAAPFGNTLINGRTNTGVDIDLALFGVEPGSFVSPAASEGKSLSNTPGELVISETAAEDGLSIGDTVTVEPLGTQLRVVGILDGQSTFGHVDVAFVPLKTWQEIRAGARPGEPVPPRVYDDITAVAVKTDSSADLAAGDAAADTTSLTLDESFGASPGYTAETSTLTLIQAFLYAISALVVGAFFTVWTIQRRQEIAVMRAMGASTGYLLRDSLMQSFILLLVSAGIGIGIGVGLGAAIGSTPMPFALETGSVAAAGGLLILFGMIGAAVAVLRITRVDPLTALGGNR
ncbi:MULTISPECIES: ABC transporter permease [Gordonia]|uniref:ABC transporter permease n=1 Tax=Gordonia alkanivorans CGMCC 6845 TaxID=1423140 RepID=W9DBH9_9ACTN|nr:MULTISPECIES: ABC transporter permease [Gordonia]ASR04430.1 FtsX-like permease family protein [Gordonia rubripertincta]ETA06778.1 ABC transporter permease [Gordonia alkanivorans CGMCC 6845]KAF0970083.1 putative ABC transporter permease [Gordonia sp. YY1]MDH3007430.1 ABC transporter permease [Gordonia alkanivorans]MDH3019639.1 ABC transporter permease [Gordonia alkanivorans]